MHSLAVPAPCATCSTKTSRARARLPAPALIPCERCAPLPPARWHRTHKNASVLMSSSDTVSSTEPVTDRPPGGGTAALEQSLPAHPSLQKHRALRISGS
jgi:hypothetical protein